MDQNPQQPQQAPDAESNNDLLGDVYDDSMEGYDKPIRNARILLYIIAGLQFIAMFTAVDLPEPENWITIGIYVLFAIIFAVLAFWTKKKPFTAIVTALSIYSALIIINAIIDPATIIKGFIIKIIVFTLMIAALKNGREVQQWLDAKREREGS